MPRAILLIGAALCSLLANAQDVYYFRSTMPDGKVVIGDKPAPGAKDVQKVPLRAGNVVPSTQSSASGGGQPLADRQGALDSADADLRAAQQELQAAQAALQAGQEPQPGERIGTAGGTSRLTDAYMQRIKSLEDAVAVAQKRFDDAQAKRNAAKY
jgi:hypothetical protein